MGSTQGASVVPTYSQQVTAAVQSAIAESGMSELAVIRLAEGDLSRSTLRRRLEGSPFYTDELETVARVLGVPVERFGAPSGVSVA